MENFLDKIRNEESTVSINKKIINSLLILCIGIALGIFSKFLDSTAINDLPFIFGYLDIGNFLGRFSIWALIAICISIYSYSSVRAALNVFVFFSGMIASYYLYSKFIAGFFPLAYAMIWIIFTIFSPLPAFICWYAKGSSKVSFIISAIMIAALFNMTFVYGWLYFEPISILEVLVFICSLIALKRNTIKETILMTVAGIAVAFIFNIFLPFHFG